MLEALKTAEVDKSQNLLKSQTRQEFTGAANWFFNGHNNKITLDYSYLTLDNDNATEVVFGNTEDHRVRIMDPDFARQDDELDMSSFDVPLYQSPETGEVDGNDVGIDNSDVNELLNDSNEDN